MLHTQTVLWYSIKVSGSSQLDLPAVVHDVVEHLFHCRGHCGGALHSQAHHTVFLWLDGIDLDRSLAVAQQHLRHDGNAQTCFHHGDVGLVVDDMAAALGADLIFFSVMKAAKSLLILPHVT